MTSSSLVLMTIVSDALALVNLPQRLLVVSTEMISIIEVMYQ